MSIQDPVVEDLPSPAPRPGRNLALELVRVTEAAAVAAGRWIGHGDEDGATSAAAIAMRTLIGTVAMRGVVVSGGHEGSALPLLFRGDEVGDGGGSPCDVAVDPLDGADLMVKDMPNALAVLAVAERGAMYDPTPVGYMDKLAVGADCADVVDIDRPVAENLRAVASAKGVRPSDLTVTVLDRSRHGDLVRDIRDAGARVHLVTGGDLASAIAAARFESDVDMLVGVGGTSQGIAAAAALACMGGSIQARLWPRNDRERGRALDAGHDLDRVLHTEDLIRGENIFFCATGVTGGDLLRGVEYRPDAATTESIVMRSKSGTVRIITGHHRLVTLSEHPTIDHRPGEGEEVVPEA